MLTGLSGFFVWLISPSIRNADLLFYYIQNLCYEVLIHETKQIIADFLEGPGTGIPEAGLGRGKVPSWFGVPGSGPAQPGVKYHNVHLICSLCKVYVEF